MNAGRVFAQPKNDAKDKFVLRFHDEGERAELKVRAAKSRRTMNAEILFLIEVGIEAIDRQTNVAQ